jgi:hypothetical protein
MLDRRERLEISVLQDRREFRDLLAHRDQKVRPGKMQQHAPLLVQTKVCTFSAQVGSQRSFVMACQEIRAQWDPLALQAKRETRGKLGSRVRLERLAHKVLQDRRDYPEKMVRLG